MSWRRRLCHIVAVADDGVIGADGGMPWHLPEELAFFRRTTMGHPLVMGNRTFQSIGKPLPGRLNIVLSRREEPGERGEGLVYCRDWPSAEAFAQAASTRWGDQIFIVGGGTLYRETASVVERVYLTRIAAKVAGDTFYPLDLVTSWRLVQREEHPGASHPFTINVYDRPS